MVEPRRGWKRQCEAFWRAHHEAWKRSDLNQRQYCEAQSLPLKGFENWRQKFRGEPEPAQRKLDGLAMLVQGVLQQDPFTGHLFVFRGRTRASRRSRLLQRRGTQGL